jgi:hypothetical protein
MSSENLKEITMEKKYIYLKIGRKTQEFLASGQSTIKSRYSIIDSISQLDGGASVSLLLPSLFSPNFDLENVISTYTTKDFSWEKIT